MTRSKDEPGQGQPQAIGADECDPIGVRFGTCARHHFKGKIKTDHSRTRARKAQRVAAGSCTNVRNPQPAHLPIIRITSGSSRATSGFPSLSYTSDQRS